MELIDEDKLLESLKARGIGVDEDDMPSFLEDGGIMGFDFSNMTPGHHGAGAADYATPGERKVETAMVEAMFQIIRALGAKEAYLVAVDDEWAPEDMEELAKEGRLTQKEATALARINAMEGGMSAIKLAGMELDLAPAVIVPQMTLFANRCAAVDPEGRYIATFSEDEEVSFNTTDEKVYRQAKEAALAMRDAVPFEMIFAEDYE